MDFQKDLRHLRSGVPLRPEEIKEFAETRDVVLGELIAPAIVEHLDFLRGEMHDIGERIKTIEKAWDRWDYDTLADLGFIRREVVEWLKEIEARIRFP